MVETMVFHVERATSEVTIDGTLEEQAWSDALAMDLNYEVRPGENIEPPVRTVCMVTHDDRNLYVAFRAYDPDPESIRARLSDRDNAWNDDWVGVVLDTFNDQRRAYELYSNPLGVQIDAINDDVGHNYDDSWNAIWKSAGRITPEGYEVEMAIPFNQIRFQAGKGEQTWGFDAVRSYPRTDRHHIGLFPRDRGNDSYLGQAAKIVGMAGADPGSNLEVIPTITAARTDQRETLPDGELREGNADAELGASVRWGITPNMSLNGAFNPDFSQIEADVLRLDINEQFALYFPETRPFFLEGADYFNTPLNLVYTRTIVDPLAALKVTGKQGRHTYGVFSARDELTNMIFPGAEGSDSGSFEMENASTVGRYRYDFGKASTVGAAVTDRRGEGYSNQVASIDTIIRFNEADRISFNAATSVTQYSDEMIEEMGVRDDTFDDNALQFEYVHSVRNWWVNANWNNFGTGFRSDLGFRPQVDYAQWRFGGAKIWWGEGDSFYRRAAWGGATGRRNRQNGELLQEHVETWANMNGPRQSHANMNITYRNQMFDGVRFDDQVFVHTWFEIQAIGDLGVTMHTDYGDWIDYTHAQPAKRTLIQPGLRYNVGRHLLLRYKHTYSALDVDGGRLFDVHAPEARIVYQFTSRCLARVIFQYSDIKRNTALYTDEVDARSRDLFTQLLFSYKVNPQTAVYVGYSDSQLGTEEYELTRASQTLFVKFGYAWVR